MPQRPDIQDALREAVDRTIRATVDTRKGVIAAVEDRLPASQDDIRALRTELRAVDERLAEIERRLEQLPPAGGA